MSIFKRRDPSQLQQQLASFSAKKGFESDGAEWKLVQDKQGNGAAVIRFLPAKGDDATTFVKLVNHGFQRNGKWYIENCSSTHGDYDSCPACQWIKEQNWDYNNEADKKAMYASGVTRKVAFWANILVIKDPANPENEGKVFKFRFGKKIMDKIQAEVDVNTDLGEEPCDVTCPFEGKNFTIKIKKVGGNNNYDDSAFGKVSQLPNIEDEAYQAQLFEQMHDIMSLVAKDKFKSFEDLSTAFNRIMGAEKRSAGRATDDFERQMQQFDEPQTPAEKAADDDVPFTPSTVGLDAELDSLLDEI
ncbi:hypothetical protein [Aeromonas phage phiWae14]|nr:hypothetical protein [Aeromonas phage phiWae14]